jgi:hypothetical protein
MLARLWSARKVELHHPADKTTEEVIAIWADYLKKQWRRHLIWLVVNGVIAPFSFLLFVLPGPNLIGYWFFYRAIHHLLVVWGIRRVRSGKIPTEFYPSSGLNEPVERARDGTVGHPALGGRAAGLAEHVEWHSPSGKENAKIKPVVEQTPRNREDADFQAEPFQDR